LESGVGNQRYKVNGVKEGVREGFGRDADIRRGRVTKGKIRALSDPGIGESR
jgi:hypothetical protein